MPTRAGARDLPIPQFRACSHELIGHEDKIRTQPPTYFPESYTDCPLFLPSHTHNLQTSPRQPNVPPPTPYFLPAFGYLPPLARLQKSESLETPPLPSPTPNNHPHCGGVLRCPSSCPHWLTFTWVSLSSTTLYNSAPSYPQQLQVILRKLTCSKLLGIHPPSSYPSPPSGIPVQQWSRLLSAPSCWAVVLL